MSDPDPAQEPRSSRPDDEEELVPADDSIIGRALRWSLLVLLAVGVLVGASLFLFRSAPEAAPEREIPLRAPEEVAPAGDPPPVPFSAITSDAGVDFVHENGAEGERLLPETMGGGVAVLDFDRDGDQDLLFVNSSRWPHSRRSGPLPTMALYENDGKGRFADVTDAAGLAVSFYGTGVAVGDVDGDGWCDLYFAAVGPNRLFRNLPRSGGGRRFVEVPEAGASGPADEWSSSSAMFDYDNDGDLDIFVGNYVRWSRQIDLELNYTLVGVGRAYGPPLNYRGTFPDLYRNDGGLRFTDVSAAAGVEIRNPATDEPVAKTLGVVPVDADRDGSIDIFVANDTVRNFFFHNRGNGTFEETAELYGLAYGREGNATGAMGVDAGYYRNDQDLGLFVGNFANEMTSLYVSQGDPTLYADEAIGEGVGATSRRMLTFGLFLLDYDLDGRLDLLQVNGHLEEEINRVDPSQEYRQPAQLFWNAGPGARSTLVAVEPATTGDLALPIVGRAAAYADFDGDGDLDLVLTQTGGPPLLLRNDQETGHHWLRVELRGDGRRSNRDAVGAWVSVETGGVRQQRQVMAARSYQSQVELPVTFGLGRAERVERLEVIWPDGSREERRDLEVDQMLRIEQQ